jgi:hypothetical protein
VQRKIEVFSTEKAFSAVLSTRENQLSVDNQSDNQKPVDKN